MFCWELVTCSANVGKIGWESHAPAQINLCLHNHGQGGLLKKHKKSAKFSSQIMTEINTQ